MSATTLKAVPPPPEITAPHVLTAIAGVMSAVSKEGIAKDRSNTQQGYKFRGIDDVYNALAPILADNNLVITPRCLSREKETVPSKNGGQLFYVTVQVEFELSSAIDGSSKIAVMYGEAMDSGDKATNKAMSAAYKYMAMQEFCIPTQGDNDADSTTHELGGAEQQAINLLKGCASRELFKGAWTSNKDSWKRLLPADAYARVAAVMQDCAAAFAAPPDPPPGPPEPPVDSFDPFDDSIPF